MFFHCCFDFTNATSHYSSVFLIVLTTCYTDSGFLNIADNIFVGLHNPGVSSFFALVQHCGGAYVHWFTGAGASALAFKAERTSYELDIWL